MRVVDDHKSHEVSNGAPDQIHDAVPHLHIVLAVDRTGRLDEGMLLFGRVLKSHLVTVEFWPSLAATDRRGCRPGYLASNARTL